MLRLITNQSLRASKPDKSSTQKLPRTFSMQITLESPNQPDVIALIAELDAYPDSLYPAEASYAPVASGESLC